MLREAAMKINPADAVQALRTERKEKEDERLYGDEHVIEASGSADRKQIIGRQAPIPPGCSGRGACTS